MQEYREARQPRSKGKQVHGVLVTRNDKGKLVAHTHYAEDGFTHHKETVREFDLAEPEEMFAHIGKQMGIKATKEEGGEEE